MKKEMLYSFGVKKTSMNILLRENILNVWRLPIALKEMKTNLPDETILGKLDNLEHKFEKEFAKEGKAILALSFTGKTEECGMYIRLMFIVQF